MIKSELKKLNTYTLISLARDGNSNALEELILRIQKDIFVMFSYLTSKREDIADLTQETLLKMAKNIKHLKHIAKFRQWINRIGLNVFYDFLKKNHNDKNIERDINKILEIKDKIGCEPGEKCLFSEMEKIIKAALLSLPEKLRIVIILREYEGLSYNDISEITQTNIGTVKSRIARARIRLQEELKEFI